MFNPVIILVIHIRYCSNVNSSCTHNYTMLKNFFNDYQLENKKKILEQVMLYGTTEYSYSMKTLKTNQK